jgi:hypothetical protein
MRPGWFCPAIFTLLCTVLPCAAAAHHSVAYYGDEVRELTGELVGVSWRNPHVALRVEVINAAGVAEIWVLECNSIYNLQRRGIEREAFMVGQAVTVSGRVSTREQRMLLAANIDLADGRTFALRTEAVRNGARDRVVDAAAESRGIFRVWSVPAKDRDAIQAQWDVQPFTDSAVAARAEWDLLDNFAIRCEPEGMPRIMVNPHPFEFIDRGSEIILRTELYDIERIIHMDQSTVPPDAPTSRLGYSVGAWGEGGDLVVRTSKIDWPYFDNIGTPQSAALEILERFSLSDDQTRLDFEITMTDPATFTRPAVVRGYWLALGETILEYDCVPLRP